MSIHESHFYLDRKNAAFADGCPGCGDDVREYGEPSEDEYEYWRFQCGCEIYWDGQILEVNDDCPDAMRQAMQCIVLHWPKQDTQP